MGKLLVFNSVAAMPEMAVSRGTMSWNKTGSWRSVTPLYRHKTPPCSFHCPAGENIRGYLDLVKKDKIAEAFLLLTQANPFPATCGRVCFHPCQAHCCRADFDTEIQVRLVERYIGDWGIEHHRPAALPAVSAKKTAIIGAGPAGLAAACYLRQKGVGVTVYDENPLPGGMLRYGVPSFRLEKDLLQAEIGRILRGVDFKANMKFGVDFDSGDLTDYDFVFLATGAHASKKLRIAGEDYPGVESGLDFLKSVNSGASVKLVGKQVIVIGGGNTACDVARTAYRLGAEVSLLYRRTEKEMPAFAEEIEQLKSEPITTDFLAAPERITRDTLGRLQVVFSRMKLAEPDGSGRLKPVPISGSHFERSADMVIAAVGEDPDLSCFPGIAEKRGENFDFSRIDRHLAAKLMVGGDLLPQPRTVPHAVASGRLAAEKIIASFDGREMDVPDNIVEVASFEDINHHYFTRVNAVQWSAGIVGAGRIIDRDAAMAEAGRCFSCGVCKECDNCYNFCPDLAVLKTPTGYHVNLDYCKGCGICAAECPCGSLKMKGEGKFEESRIGK